MRQGILSNIIRRFFLFLIIFTSHTNLLAADAQESILIEDGRYYFSFTPKILGDRIQNDYSLGLFYTEARRFGGEIRYRNTNSFGLNEIWDIDDSMLAIRQESFEVHLMPVRYQFLRGDMLSMRAGAGAYYNYSKSDNRGYFLYHPAGPDSYNAYHYNFSGHSVGPMLDADINFNWRFLYASFSAGLAPVYYLDQTQEWYLSPLMSPASYSVSSGEMSGPYYYLNLDVAFDFFGIFSLFGTMFFEYNRLCYRSIDTGITSGWTEIDTKDEFITLALEISILIKMGRSGIMPQIGYGRTFNEQGGGDSYFIIGLKNFGFRF